jgi:hypothetical protein
MSVVGVAYGFLGESLDAVMVPGNDKKMNSHRSVAGDKKQNIREPDFRETLRVSSFG